MTYGERGTAIDPATLKKIFSDAMRWQLERILVDQTASGADPKRHAMTNMAYAEMWRIFSRADAIWTADDDERLAAAGWPPEARLIVADLWEENRHGPLVSVTQLEAYERKFGFQPTSSNLDRVRRAILSARGAACAEATKRLGAHPGDFGDWVDAALDDDAPFAFEEADAPITESPMPSSRQTHPSSTVPSEVAASPEPAPPAPHQHQQSRSKKLLRTAAEECIDAHIAEKAWSPDSIEQVRAAIRLFDFACGGDIAIDDLEQAHVTAFHELCRKMPNRWGKTRDEIARGLVASVEYGEQLKASGQESRLGFSKKTIDKHVTWIGVVLGYADDDGGRYGHRPAVRLKFDTTRAKIGSKSQAKKQRARDLRANWTAKEINRLLEAPPWSGCASLDERFIEGSEIFHDGFYWLPLMYILYGGRSSELAGLPIADVFEKEEIAYFKVDYSDLRALKNVQSIRKLPIHPQLIRLGFLDYIAAMRDLGHELLFPELYSKKSKSFASTFYKSIFQHWRAWGFPDGTEWRHQARGIIKDKDVHSFRGVAGSLMKGKVEDSVRFDILGHEGGNTTQSVYDEEASLEEKLKALELVSPVTAHLKLHPLRMRPAERQRFGARRGAPPRKRVE